ncbi:MAG: hypothetical protein M3Y82_03630 [Verrucomicrobiota bacterium]|nr:hypothetical protein [Verrucomicrobiota bacterium]
MSLMQLLSASHSVSLTRNGPTPYKMMAPYRAPKFASARRPVFSSAPKVGTIISETPSLFEARSPLPKPASELEKSVLETTEPITEKKLFFFPQQKKLNRFWKRILSVWLGPKKNKPVPIQTEWKLEHVAVMRNDLNETDLEIVAGKKEAAPLPIACKREKVEQALNRLKNSFKNVPETFFK